MIFISILIFILAFSLTLFKKQITPIYFTRMVSLVFLYAGALTFNALYIQSIGSGIGIFNELFQVTYYEFILTIFNLFLIFIFSIFFNFYILNIINTELFGIKLKNKLSNLLEGNIYLFFIVPFLISFLILIYLNNFVNIIHLTDKDIFVTAEIQNARFTFTGDAFNSIFNNLGSAAVFSAGARFAAGLVVKHKLHLLPKTGIIGSFGAGFTITFKIISNTFARTYSSNSSIDIGDIKIVVDGLKLNPYISNKEKFNVLNKFFGSEIPENQLRIIRDYNKITIESSKDNTSRVINELEKYNPIWRDGFINSPIEKGDLDPSLKQFLIDNLTYNLILQFIILYLLIMIIVIFSCKIVIENDIKFNQIKLKILALRPLAIGKFLFYLFNKYISFWRKGVNIWIYFILFSLIIFLLGESYSINHMILLLK